MIHCRCALIWVLSTAAAGGFVRWLLTAPDEPGLEGRILRLCSLALVACTTWAWLAATSVIVDALRRRAHVRRGVPAALRRVVLAACGLTVLAAASPALATPGPVPLHGTAAPVEPRAAAVVVVPTLERHDVVVRPGDSLWSIAKQQLPPTAADGEVAAAWPRIYDANRAVIGDDPGLLLPGERLELPR